MPHLHLGHSSMATPGASTTMSVRFTEIRPFVAVSISRSGCHCQSYVSETDGKSVRAQTQILRFQVKSPLSTFRLHLFVSGKFNHKSVLKIAEEDFNSGNSMFSLFSVAWDHMVGWEQGGPGWPGPGPRLAGWPARGARWGRA